MANGGGCALTAGCLEPESQPGLVTAAMVHELGHGALA